MGTRSVADLLLVDERDARLQAERRHLRVVGTLRVLADGVTRGLTDRAESFSRDHTVRRMPRGHAFKTLRGSSR
jgi:predicted nucleic acid-binding protein